MAAMGGHIVIVANHRRRSPPKMDAKAPVPLSRPSTTHVEQSRLAETADGVGVGAPTKHGPGILRSSIAEATATIVRFGSGLVPSDFHVRFWPRIEAV